MRHNDGAFILFVLGMMLVTFGLGAILVWAAFFR